MRRNRIQNENRFSRDISSSDAATTTLRDRLRNLEEEVSVCLRFRETLDDDLKRYKSSFDYNIKTLEINIERKKDEIYTSNLNITNMIKTLETKIGVDHKLMDDYKATFNKYEIIIANSFEKLKEFDEKLEKYKDSFWSKISIDRFKNEMAREISNLKLKVTHHSTKIKSSMGRFKFKSKRYLSKYRAQYFFAISTGK